MSRKIKRLRLPAIGKSIIDPGQALQDAIDLHRQGRLDEAEARYRKILSQHPKQADALNLLATLHQQRGDYRQALPLLQKAITLQPGRADYHTNLGSAHRSLGERDKAITSFRKAQALQPGHLESLFNLAMSLLEGGDLAAATAGFQKILQTRPTFLPAQEMLANTLLSQGFLAEALACLQEIVRLDSQNHGAFCEIGNILQAQGEFAAAITAYEHAIALVPHYAVAHNNLGNTLVKQGRLHAAMASYQEALRYDPDLGEAYVNLSWTYKEHGMIEEDVACLRRYLKRHPENHRAHSDMLFSMNYDPAYSQEQLYAAACNWWQQHAPDRKKVFSHPPPPPGQKLKIGFLSPDFREHPVGTFLLPLFTALDKEKVSLCCYAEMREPQMDSLSRQLREQASAWFSTAGVPPSEAASRISQDQLDILIDLAGHSAGNRLDIMALQAAPIQVSWLGYVNTTGLPIIDYRLTDAVADPPGMEAYYSETLLRLPDAFFCYAPPALAPDIGELPALSSGHITYGSLNNPAKITPEVIALWAKVLLQTPNSRLILVGKPFADEFIRERYLALFASHGVATDRIEPLSTLPMRDYLQLYNKIDIALDPFPHNGHTITCHTLWMGVPVVTLAGNRYAARMGASIMSVAGLSELIAQTPAEYLSVAASLANDLERLAALRHTLRQRLRKSAICDTRRFAENFLLTMQAIRTPASRQNKD